MILTHKQEVLEHIGETSSSIYDKAYQQGRADQRKEDEELNYHYQTSHECYQQGRADELDKISRILLCGCDEIDCGYCVYKEYSRDVCRQAFSFEELKKYISRTVQGAEE